MYKKFLNKYGEDLKHLFFFNRFYENIIEYKLLNNDE